MFNKTELTVGCFGLLLATLFIGAFFGGINIVQPATSAVVQRLGTLDQSPRGPGIYLDIPFLANWTYFDLKVQAHTSKQTAATRDLQDIVVDTTVSTRLIPEKVSELYTSVGSAEEFNIRVLTPAVSESVKVVTAQYSAENLIANRAQVTQKALDLLREAVAKYPVEIVDVALTNIEFTNEQFNKAIDQKQIAEQQALQAKYELEKSKVQAEQQRVLQQSLTDTLLRKMWIEKWDGKLPSYVGGGDILTTLGLK